MAAARSVVDGLPPTVGVCTHQPSGATVFVIGCLHGSPQSAGDVAQIIECVAPAAVVLELCPRRWKSLIKRVHIQATPESRKPASAVIFKWWRGVRKAYIKRGLGHAVVAASISSLYLIQELVAGYDPGAEFKAAVAAMARLPEPPEVVLGDRDVHSTVGDLTDVSSLMGGLLSPSEIRRNSAVARRIVYGGRLPGAQAPSIPQPTADTCPKVSIPAAMSHVGVDLARTLLPFCLLGWGLANLAVEAVHTGDSVSDSGGNLSAAVEGTLLVLVPLLWLRLCDVIVTERDILLAECIIRACEEGRGAPVVAVLGLFHCNAVLAKVSSGDPTA